MIGKRSIISSYRSASSGSSASSWHPLPPCAVSRSPSVVAAHIVERNPPRCYSYSSSSSDEGEGESSLRIVSPPSMRTTSMGDCWDKIPYLITATGKENNDNGNNNFLMPHSSKPATIPTTTRQIFDHPMIMKDSSAYPGPFLVQQDDLDDSSSSSDIIVVDFGGDVSAANVGRNNVTTITDSNRNGRRIVKILLFLTNDIRCRRRCRCRR